MDKHTVHARLCVVALAVLGGLVMLPFWWRFPSLQSAHTIQLVHAEDSRQSVVVNEIGWGGTPASAFDEWIELHNTTGLTVSLAGWHIVALDGSPQITLSGEIVPGGYYLIERTDDGTISNVVADLVCTFGSGLSNEGESLVLQNAIGTAVDTVNFDGGSWPNSTEGASPEYRSLERVTPWAADIDGSWVSNDCLIVTGVDAGGASICGTPASVNSAYVPLISAVAELAVDVSGPDSCVSGETIVLQLILRNLGGLSAQSTLVSAALPDSLELLDYSGGYPATVTAASLTWALGDLPPGVTQQMTLSAQASTAVLPGDQLVTAVWASTVVAELVTSNNRASWETQVTSGTAVPGEVRVLVSGVLYDGYQYGDADEAVQLTNTSDATAPLSGWALCDLADCYPLPDASVAPGSSLWMARDVDAFRTSFGFDADYELAAWPALNNDGDAVMLVDPEGSVVDTLVYKGGSTALPGWSGGALSPYLGLMGESGQILSRKRDEASGLPITDSNSALDWIQSLVDPVAGRRVQYPGWDLDPLFFPLRTAETATVIVGVAPDNAYDVVAATLQQAQRAISIEVYSLRHPAIIDLLVEKARAGVQVTVLLEGDPVGLGVYSPEWQTQLYGCRELEAAGGACWFMVHDTDAGRYQRYLYVHAKLLLVDDTWVVISTQNLTVGGLPADDKSNGSFGSRGVVLATDAPEIVRRVGQIFSLDFDPPHHQDLLRWNTGLDTIRYGLPVDALIDLDQPDGISYTVAFAEPLSSHGTYELELLSSPESALRQSDSLLGLLARAGAGDTILVEQLYEIPLWGSESQPAPNPRLEACIAASRRGATVRVLVNGLSFVDGQTLAEEGALTVAYLRSVAQSEGLDLEAAIGNPTGDGIHNKMILVDLNAAGKYVHIGSINGSEASSKVNREVALQVQSAEIFDYLRRPFYFDWWTAHPTYLPILMRSYTPPQPPATYVVISEVAYAVALEAEWIELHNPTSYPVDLSRHKLGDAETRSSYEPMFCFPPNTTIGAGETLVIAVNGDQVPEADLEFYETAAAVPNMVIYPGWGTSAYPLALRNLGDQVLLLGPDDAPVDVVLWGDAVFPGTIPHPGVTVVGASLERYPPGVDSDNCAVDLRERYPPTPGELPVFPMLATVLR